MNQLYSVLILACLVTLAVSSQGLGDLSVEEGTAMFECFGKILCVANSTSHFRNMLHETGPVCQVKVFEWVHRIYKMDAKDDPVFWETFRVLECEKEEDLKKEQIKEFFMEVSNYHEEACKKPSHEECVGLSKAMKKAREEVTNYTAIGVCENGSQAAKKGVEQTQMTGEELKKAPKPGMMRGR